MHERTISLIGEENLKKIESKNILVIGVGGVGGYVCEALVRSGIRNITLIDKDVIEESNINRQIIALHSTIGKKKVDVLKKRLEDINPLTNVKAIDSYIKVEDIENLNLSSYDYVVDAIDDVKVKVALARYALENNINLIISTGTAKKLHPELLKMTTLDKTSYDPLAKKMRAELKGFNTHKLKVLASEESPISTLDGGLGSIAFVPSSGGLLIASYIINKIISEG